MNPHASTHSGKDRENLARLLPDLGIEDPALRHREDADAAYQGRLLALLLNRNPGQLERQSRA